MAKHMAGPQGGHYRLKQPQKRKKHNRIPARILKSRARLLLSGAGCIAAVLIITALLAMPHQNAEPIEAAASPEAAPGTAAESISDKASVLSKTTSAPESAFQQLGDWRLVLVNSEVPLPDDFQMTPTLFDTITVNSKMYPELTALINAAYNDEINLWIASGYRSVEEQESVLDRAVQRRMADGMTYEKAYEDARITIQAPGYSEHHRDGSLHMAAGTRRRIRLCRALPQRQGEHHRHRLRAVALPLRRQGARAAHERA